MDLKCYTRNYHLIQKTVRVIKEINLRHMEKNDRCKYNYIITLNMNGLKLQYKGNDYQTQLKKKTRSNYMLSKR